MGKEVGDKLGIGFITLSNNSMKSKHRPDYTRTNKTEAGKISSVTSLEYPMPKARLPTPWYFHQIQFSDHSV